MSTEIEIPQIHDRETARYMAQVTERMRAAGDAHAAGLNHEARHNIREAVRALVSMQTRAVSHGSQQQIDLSRDLAPMLVEALCKFAEICEREISTDERFPWFGAAEVVS